MDVDYKSYKKGLERKWSFSKLEDLNKWDDNNWKDFYRQLKERFPKGYIGSKGFSWNKLGFQYEEKAEYFTYLEIVKDKIYVRAQIENIDINEEIISFIWDKLEQNIGENFLKKEAIFNKGSGPIIAEISGYKTKDQLYRTISLVNSIYNRTRLYLKGINAPYPEEDTYYTAENIGIIDGVVREDLLIENDIVLITGINIENFKHIFELGKYVFFYIFDERDTLDRFRQSLINSKEYLEGGFNLGDIRIFTSSPDKIKIIRHVENFDKVGRLDDVLAFIDSNEREIDKLKGLGDHVLIFRDEDMGILPI